MLEWINRSILAVQNIIARYPIGLFILIGIFTHLTRYNHALMPDEAYNWFSSNQGWKFAFDQAANDFFPPLYPVFLSAWLNSLPHSEFLLRLPSMIFSIVGMTLFFLWIRLWFNQAVLFCAAILIVTSPFLSFWGQFTKPFAMELMGLCGALYFSFKFMYQMENSCPRIKVIISAILLAGFGLVAVYSNHGAPFSLAAIYIAAILNQPKRTGKKFVFNALKLLIPFIAIAIIWIPVALIAFEQLMQSHELKLPHTKSNIELLIAWYRFFTAYNVWTLEILSFGVFITLFILGIVKIQKSYRGLLIPLLVMAVLFPAILIFFAITIEPVFARVFERSHWLAMVYLLLAGVGLVYVNELILKYLPFNLFKKSNVGQMTLVLLLLFPLAINLRGLTNTSMAGTAPWDQANTLIEDYYIDTDIILGYPGHIRNMLYYYLPESKHAAFGKETENPFSTEQNLCDQMPDFTVSRFWLFSNTDSDVVGEKIVCDSYHLQNSYQSNRERNITAALYIFIP